MVIEYYPEGVAERRVLTLQEIVRFKPLREGDKVDSTVVTVQRMPFAEGLSEEEATEKWEELNEQAQKDIAEEYPGIF